MARATNKPLKTKGRRPRRTADSVSSKPKAGQRERLVEAMIEVCAEVGYQATSIAEVSSRAGVSSATFYEQFAGKEDCFVAAYHAAAERLFAQMGLLLAQGDWSDRGRRVLVELTEALRDDPNAGRLLLIEALGGGGEQLGTERKALVSIFERLTQTFVDHTAPEGKTFDIPILAVMGALRHIVSRHLRTDAEDQLPELVEPGIAWLQSYAVPAESGRWSTSQAALLPAPVGALSSRPEPPPPRQLPRGRHGLPAGVVARSRRTRIIYGTAEVMMSKGFANATVADIVARARVARDVFYEHFEDKEHAFLEAQAYPTQFILDSCAAAYFSMPEWPDRVWKMLEMLTRLIRESPAISHLRLVEAYAAGPTATRRAEEITRSFTIFLEEGYHYRPEAEDLPRLYGQAIAGAIFELIQRHAARGEADSLIQHVPQLTYIAIAPFTGAEEAIELVERMMARQEGQLAGNGRREAGKGKADAR
jgi:AcrR family transcriptional regulator